MFCSWGILNLTLFFDWVIQFISLVIKTWHSFFHLCPIDWGCFSLKFLFEYLKVLFFFDYCKKVDRFIKFCFQILHFALFHSFDCSHRLHFSTSHISFRSFIMFVIAALKPLCWLHLSHFPQVSLLWEHTVLMETWFWLFVFVYLV